jgi:hypothetical protein
MLDTLTTMVDSLPAVVDTLAAVADTAMVAVEAPNEAVAETSWVTLGNLMEILVALMVLVKVIVNLTPTERDNKVFGLVDSILNAVVPDRRKA